MHPHVGLQTYVIDFAILKADDGHLTCRVIELNPYATSTGTVLYAMCIVGGCKRWTGAALFHWRVDEAILQGQDPFEFRMRTSFITGLIPFASVSMRMLLHAVLDGCVPR